MNILFAIITVLSIIALCFVSPDSVTAVMLSGTSEGVKLMIKLIAVYALWNGVLKLFEGVGLDKKICSFLKPITKKIFPDVNENAINRISMNITSNFLGLGGAGTTTGIQAVSAMDIGYASRSVLIFFIINVTSIQFLPTTVIALRAEAGSATPSDIFLPSLIATTFTTVLGVGGVFFMERLSATLSSLKTKKIKSVK